MYCIYRIRNKINSNTYIGQHKYTDKTNPIGQYKGSGKLLWLAYKKYGFDNFETEILYSRIRDKSTVDAMEIWAIEKYKPEYNIAKGGTGGDTYSGLPREQYETVCQKLRQHRHTEETKQRLRQYDRSYLHTDENIKKRVETFKQNHHHSWNSGKTMSEEWKKAHPNGALGHTWSCKGQKRTPEQIERNRQAQKEYASNPNYVNPAKGRHWYTNGIDNLFVFEQPEGYWKGMTKSKEK